jgi:hypothetical protein
VQILMKMLRRLHHTALQTCFQDLIAKQEEPRRNKRRNTQLIHTQGRISLIPRLHRAVATLKLQAPDTDPKAAFWMKMADEHDKEFCKDHAPAHSSIWPSRRITTAAHCAQVRNYCAVVAQLLPTVPPVLLLRLTHL